MDVHPDAAALLKELIGNRTSGYLFCSESGQPLLYSNILKNIWNPIMWDRERPIMRREGKGWKKVGAEKIPGVLGPKPDDDERTGYGFHSFRRFRQNHLQVENVQQMFIDYWFGHGKKTISDIYKKCQQLVQKRRELCEQAGLGFNLEAKNIVEIKTDKKEKAA